MAPGRKLYPRATVKKIIKAESDCNVSKDADVTVSKETFEAYQAPSPMLFILDASAAFHHAWHPYSDFPTNTRSNLN